MTLGGEVAPVRRGWKRRSSISSSRAMRCSFASTACSAGDGGVARAGAQVARIDRPWGEVFSPEEIKRAVEQAKPQAVGIVMAETSTGASQPLEDISRIVHDAGALLLVDAVTSLGGMSVETDAWGFDAIYSGTQKCLGCPPGLAPLSFSPRAMEKIGRRKSKVQSWYLDVTMLAQYWGQERVYHHRRPINMTYGSVARHCGSCWKRA